jgi:endonuclease III
MTDKKQDLAPNAQKKLFARLEKLEKQVGKLQLLPDAKPLEQAIYLMLREGTDFRKAQKAMKVLAEEYVEWNELRVATPKEVVAVLKPIGLSDVDDKVSRILALLSRLFYDFHKKDLEFVRVFPPPQREKILRTLDPLGLPITYVLLQYYEDRSMSPDGIVVCMEAFNYLVKEGLVRKTASDNIAKKILEKLVPVDDRYRFHYLITRLI